MGGGALWDSCSDSLPKSLGMHRMSPGPRIHASRERWRSLISLVLRLRVSNKISSQPVVCLLSSCHCFRSTSEAMICTCGMRRRAEAATLRACVETQVLFLLVWDCFWPKPPYATSSAADGVCSVQSGGGPFVYLSMGWNDRAKLLERAQL